MSVYLKVRVNIHIQFVNIYTNNCMQFYWRIRLDILFCDNTRFGTLFSTCSTVFTNNIFFESYVFIFEGFLVALVRIYLVSSWERQEDQALKYLKIEVFRTIIVSDLSRWQWPRHPGQRDPSQRESIVDPSSVWPREGWQCCRGQGPGPSLFVCKDEDRPRLRGRGTFPRQPEDTDLSRHCVQVFTRYFPQENTNDNNWTDFLDIISIQFVKKKQTQTYGNEKDAHAHNEENQFPVSVHSISDVES